MNAIYLITIIAGCAAQNVLKKAFTNKRGRGGVFFFGALTALAALLFFICSGGKLNWEPGLWPYSLGFALSYGAGTVGAVAAVHYGPLALTGLMTSYSLLMPTLYGLIFLKDPIGVGLFPGLALLVISLALITRRNDEAPITLKWGIFVALAFLGNGMCSVVQKMQQVAFGGGCKSEFMILALGMVVLLLGGGALLRERKELQENLKAGWYLAVPCGLSNGLVNLFVMILSALMPVSVMFPLISAGGIVTTYLFARFLYREKLTKIQLVGFVLGIGSIVLLNL